MSFQQAIIPIVPKGVQNIFPTDVVLECGSSKLNKDFVHAPNLAQKCRKSKVAAKERKRALGYTD
ncbi:hypothetical protein AGMMS50268_28500 [Spirochaetia bacterium]|nr:hypothetical protein AGMMS50268_28500 [Spirochaetia bacterium]